MKNNPCEKCSDRIENAVKAKRIKQLYDEILILEKRQEKLFVWILGLLIIILMLIGVVSR